MLDNMRRVGGVAAGVAAATFVFGFILLVTALSDYATGDPTPTESVDFLVDNAAILRLWNVVIFIVFGIALVPVCLAAYGLLKDEVPGLAQIATAFGLIWAGLVLATGMVANIGIGTVVDLHDADPARAEPVWSALESVQNGMGGGNEVVGGLWVLLISWAALRAAKLPAGLCYLGLLAGIAGLVTVVPALELVGAVFGIGIIVWMIWFAVVMLRPSSGAAD